MFIEVTQLYYKSRELGNVSDLHVRCTDPSISGTFTLLLDQEKLDSIEAFKGYAELLKEENRPQLAKAITKRAKSLFILEERNSRVQLVLAGESDEASLAKRLESLKATASKLQNLKRAAEASKRKLQSDCRVIRLEEFRKAAARQRGLAQRKALVASVKEWQGMHAEDLASQSTRTYLTCDSVVLKEIQLAFEVFDSDGSGSISASEFQELCFELGIVMTEREVVAAVREIDTDGNGTLQFHEFAEWWVTEGPSGQGDSDDINTKMLAMKLKMLKRAKEMYGKLNIMKGRKGKKIEALNILEEDTNASPFAALWGGGTVAKGKASRPQTV